VGTSSAARKPARGWPPNSPAGQRTDSHGKASTSAHETGRQKLMAMNRMLQAETPRRNSTGARREFEKLPFTMSWRIGVGDAKCCRDPAGAGAVLEGLVRSPDIAGLADGDILAWIKPHDLEPGLISIRRGRLQSIKRCEWVLGRPGEVTNIAYIARDFLSVQLKHRRTASRNSFTMGEPALEIPAH